MKGQTKKPCHGCGESGYREADKLCGICQKELREARAIIAATEVNPNLAEYRRPWTYYSLPYIPNLGYQNDEISTQFRTAMRELILSLSIPKKEGRAWTANLSHVIDGTSDDEGTILLDPAIRETLNTFYKSALQMVDIAYKNGKSEGQSFVTQLAAGEISIDQLNKAAAAGK